MKFAKCAKCSVMVGFTNTLPKGVVYCTTHNPVIVVTPEQVSTQEAFNAVMSNPNTVLSLNNSTAMLEESIATARAMGVPEEKIMKTEEDINEFFLGDGTTTEVAATEETKQTIKEKVETKMTNVKETVSNTTATVIEKATVAKDAVVNTAKDIKAKGFKATMSDVWALIKKGAKKVKDFTIAQAGTIGITAGSVVVAGAVTTGATSAVAVGTGIALVALTIKELLAKKKEKQASAKGFMVKAATAMGTAVALPFALYGLAMAGLLVTSFAVILPYAVIVA